MKIEELARIEDANENTIILLKEYLFRCVQERSEKLCNILFNFGLTFDWNAIETDRIKPYPKRTFKYLPK